jgi:hypothetical protein
MAPVQVLSELAAVHASGHITSVNRRSGAQPCSIISMAPRASSAPNAIAEDGELARARGAHQDIVDQQDSLIFNRGSRCRDNWRAQTNFCHVIARPRRAAPLPTPGCCRALVAASDKRDVTRAGRI